MNLFNGIVSLLSAMAWPVTTFIIVLCFRKEFKQLLGNFGGVVKRATTDQFDINIGDQFRVTFGEQLKKAEQDIVLLGEPGTGESTQTPNPSGNVLGPPALPPPSRQLDAGRGILPRSYYLQHLSKLAEISPRGAILEAWKELELSIVQAATYEGRIGGASRESGGGQRLPPPVSVSAELLVRQFAELGRINEETLGIFEDLRQLRNQVAHVRAFEPSVAQAQEYVRLALDLADRIRWMMLGLPPPANS